MTAQQNFAIERDVLEDEIEAASIAVDVDPGRKWYERWKSNFYGDADDMPHWEGLLDAERSAWNLLDEQSTEIMEEGA